MMRRLIPVFSLLAIAGVAVAFPEATRDDAEYARKKFEVWRQFPEQLAKLRQAAETFAALPPARQEQIEQLDLDLAKEPSAVQAHLQNVADRYADWLAQRSEKDRERIRQAPDKAARLAIVRELREADWLRQQPKALQNAIAARPVDARPAALAKARDDDRQRQSEWAVARAFWDDMAKNKPLPTKLADFETPVQNYVNDILLRLLSKDDRERLARAEGQWPLYPQTLVELADSHPPALPSPDGPRLVADLPKSVRDSLTKKGLGAIKEKVIEKRLRSYEGRYPDFAKKLTSLASENNWIMPQEWWAYNFNNLSPTMQDFIKKKLEPLLEKKESRELFNAEGTWPDYPETIQRLARIHNLRIPWHTLPGNRERWDNYRSHRPPIAPGFPELPRYKLRDFVFFDLDDVERVKFKNEIERSRPRNDNDAWAYLVELYFQRYPSELTRLRQADREALGRIGP